jgi:hypothetical protein
MADRSRPSIAFQLPASEAAAHAGERCFTQPARSAALYCRPKPALQRGSWPAGSSSAIRSSSSGACVSRSYGSPAASSDAPGSSAASMSLLMYYM